MLGFIVPKSGVFHFFCHYCSKCGLWSNLLFMSRKICLTVVCIWNFWWSQGGQLPPHPPGRLCPWIQDEEILSLIALSLYIFFYKIMPTCHIMWIPHSAYSSKLCSCKSESNCHSEDSILLSSEWSKGNSTFSFTLTCPFSFTLGSSTYRVL